MRVLFASFDGGDYLASMLLDGLQEVLGWENVADAGNNQYFHRFPEKPRDPNEMICSTRKCKKAVDEDDFDLLVLNAAFLRQHDWHFALRCRERLLPWGKIAYVEGWDSAHEVHNPLTECGPPFHVDAVFRREIDPDFSYPYAAHHLDFAAPARWFEETEQKSLTRDIDVFWIGTNHSCPVRPRMVEEALKLGDKFNVVVHGEHRYTAWEHLDMLRRSKIALIPPGADYCNCLACWCAIAAGAVPVFVEHPRRTCEPNFFNIVGAWCQVESLADTVKMLMAVDCKNIHDDVLSYGKMWHSTKTRAEKLLQITMGL
jgi:hypothetical protein